MKFWCKSLKMAQNIHAYPTNRRYMDCLPKPQISDESLNSNMIRKISATLLEGRDPLSSFGQHPTWVAKGVEMEGVRMTKLCHQSYGLPSLRKSSQHKM